MSHLKNGHPAMFLDANVALSSYREPANGEHKHDNMCTALNKRKYLVIIRDNFC